MTVVLLFVLCVGVILFAGTQLTHNGDVLAERSGLGRTWIGVVLLASVTSLAELITGVSSVLIFDVPDIAAGDVLGSCVFNVLVLALADALFVPCSLTSRAHSGHVLSAGFGVLLLGIVSMSLLAGTRLPAIGWIGVSSPALFGVYLLSMYMIFRHERARIAVTEDSPLESLYGHVSTKRAATLFTVNALFIVLAATFLPHLAEEIAVMTGLGQTFVGAVLVALSTSLPEVVVTFAAIRLGAVDMVIGNLFGSNLFNIAILALDDALYVKGPILAHVSPTHIVSAVAAMTVTSIAVIGLAYRSPRTVFRFGFDSLGIIAVYVASTLLLYAMR